MSQKNKVFLSSSCLFSNLLFFYPQLTLENTDQSLPNQEIYQNEFQKLEVTAQQGHAQAQCDLGVMYEYGRGVSKDEEEAVRWFQIAAFQELAQAQCNLGVMYKFGRGVPKDEKEAVKWFQRAALQGHARAQCILGVMYGCGRGVPKDKQEAVRWFEMVPLHCFLGPSHR